MDSSIEIITVIGKRKITDSVEATILEVKNLTKSRIDSNYVFYYRANFIVTEKYPANINFYAKSNYLYPGDMRFRFPLIEGPWQKKDTTAIVLNKPFPNCRYTYEYRYDFQGANAYSYTSESFLQNNVGFVFWKTGSSSSSHYGSHSEHWFVRRIMDYYIAP